jgi:D-glycero-D-manno-heptose 1,7-bisphosphate phosphatase
MESPFATLEANPIATRVPVLYLDLDGTVRHGFDELGRFVNGPEDVVIFDGVTEKLNTYKKAGWRIIGVSNQGGIALGHMTLRNCALSMLETQMKTEEAFDKIVWCQHHPNAHDLEMARCWCRKPRPGMIIEGASVLSAESKQRFGREEIYPPHMALMVGDRPEDREAAEAANIDFVEAAWWRDNGNP